MLIFPPSQRHKKTKKEWVRDESRAALAIAAEVDTVSLPAAANVRAIYSGVVLQGATNVAGARHFFDWNSNHTVQEVLERYGFAPAP